MLFFGIAKIVIIFELTKFFDNYFKKKIRYIYRRPNGIKYMSKTIKNFQINF